MSLTTDAWLLTYNAQTAALEVAILATVTGFGTNKPAIISKVALDDIYLEGPHGEAGGWEIQIRISDLSAEPPKRTAISCNGEATGFALQVMNVDRTGGIFTITARDFSGVNK